jgi:tetratricopeptide (TPR) repeat protein
MYFLRHHQSIIGNRQSSIFITFLIVSILVLLTSPLQAQTKDAVITRTESLVIPTYELGQDDPNPYFGTGYREVYPYPFQDWLTDHRVDKAWKAVILENRYLKVVVLPELGGHVYSVYDKSFKREVFYRNHVVKYGLVGLRGAWVSGGIEFNFPNGHTVTSVSPIDFAVRRNPEGSASIVVGDHEKVSRMHWFVTLTLYPDKSYLEQEVFLYNRTPLKNRYWFWANAAVPAADDMQYVYPMTSAYPHAKFPVYSFPVYQGRDLSWWKNIDGPLSLFARASKRDFFGAYYDQKDFGVVHVADFHEVPGKKTWTWGTAPSGRIWDTLLSDQDGPYAEIQSGRFETQLDYEFLDPHEANYWKEYWYPINRMGSFVSANRDAAINLKLLPDAEKPQQVLLAVNPTEPMNGAWLTLVSGGDGKELLRRKLTASPDRPYSERVEIPKSDWNAKNLILKLTDAASHEVIRFAAAEPSDGNPRPPAIPKEPPTTGDSKSIEETYLQGVNAEKQGEDSKAREFYTKALQADPGHSKSHLALGILLYKAGEADHAHQEIESGLRRDPYDDVAHYYHGLYHREHGELDLAKDNFWSLVRGGPYAALGHYCLGETALWEKKFEEAIGHFNKAATMNPLDVKAQDLWAIANRKAGRFREAQTQIEKVLRFDPLDYLGLYEGFLIQLESKNLPVADEAKRRVLEMFQRDDEIWLEVHQDYQNLGLIEESLGLLRLAVDRPKEKRVHPLLLYHLGYCLDLLGRTEEARREFSEARKADSEYGFPHRLESLAVLQTALKYDPQDDKALYYVGNLLYSRKRYAEAQKAWESSVVLNPAYSVAQRNLGFASWKQDHDLEKAARHYEKAVSANKDDYRLYRDLDQLYSLTRQQEKRAELLDQAPASVRQVQDIALARARLDVDRGNYRQALELLMSRSFKPWEGGIAIRDVYIDATIGLGDQALARREHAVALEAYGRALEYPQNLGVGAPAKAHDARTWYLMSEVYVAQGEVDKAKQVWEQIAREEDPPASESSYYRALALKKLSRDAESSGLLDQLVSGPFRGHEESSSDGVPSYLAGLGEEGKGNIERARSAFEEALKLDPRLWRAKRALQRLNEGR